MYQQPVMNSMGSQNALNSMNAHNAMNSTNIMNSQNACSPNAVYNGHVQQAMTPTMPMNQFSLYTSRATPCSPVAGRNKQLLQSKHAFRQTVLFKLEAIESKLTVKLDTIEREVSGLSTKLTKVDVRVQTLESNQKSTESKLSEIEASHSFDSQTFDEINKKTNPNRIAD